MTPQNQRKEKAINPSHEKEGELDASAIQSAETFNGNRKKRTRQAIQEKQGRCQDDQEAVGGIRKHEGKGLAKAC